MGGIVALAYQPLPNSNDTPKQVQQLKLERDAMERALRREMGDDMPLTKLLDAESDWRGRAQTIALLKEKLLSLHETHAQVWCYTLLFRFRMLRMRVSHTSDQNRLFAYHSSYMTSL